jgi:hypothetical protein
LTPSLPQVELLTPSLTSPRPQVMLLLQSNASIVRSNSVKSPRNTPLAQLSSIQPPSSQQQQQGTPDRTPRFASYSNTPQQQVRRMPTATVIERACSSMSHLRSSKQRSRRSKTLLMRSLPEIHPSDHPPGGGSGDSSLGPTSGCGGDGGSCGDDGGVVACSSAEHDQKTFSELLVEGLSPTRNFFSSKMGTLHGFDGRLLQPEEEEGGESNRDSGEAMFSTADLLGEMASPRFLLRPESSIRQGGIGGSLMGSSPDFESRMGCAGSSSWSSPASEPVPLRCWHEVWELDRCGCVVVVGGVGGGALSAR